MTKINNFRLYGESPFSVIVVHGGPGAGGELAQVAQTLEAEFGVLEPLQTRLTLDGQVDELRWVVEQQADLPASLVGFSWGAWLSYILTAKHPEMVKKLILVGSGPYRHQDVERIKAFRFHRIENYRHKPWIERQAKEKFYKILRSELSGAQS